MDAANIRNLFQSRYDRKPSTWHKIGIPHEGLDNIDLDLVVHSSQLMSSRVELPRPPVGNLPFKICGHRPSDRPRKQQQHQHPFKRRNDVPIRR